MRVSERKRQAKGKTRDAMEQTYLASLEPDLGMSTTEDLLIEVAIARGRFFGGVALLPTTNDDLKGGREKDQRREERLKSVKTHSTAVCGQRDEPGFEGFACWVNVKGWEGSLEGRGREGGRSF